MWRRKEAVSSSRLELRQAVSAALDLLASISSPAGALTPGGLSASRGLFSSSFPCRLFFGPGLGILGNERSQPFPEPLS